MMTSKKKRALKRINIASICLEMGWDYHTYMSQPVWFVKIVANLISNKYKNDNSKTTNPHRRTGQSD